MRFRKKLARQLGIELDEMEGFTDTGSGRSWDTLPADPIHGLLDHSDCDGELTPDECRRVAPRLRELVATWPDDDYDKIHAIELADGMDTAAYELEPLRFR